MTRPTAETGSHPAEPKRRRRHLARYRQIATVLARHGMGYLTHMVGLGRLVPFHLRHRAHVTRPEHVRMALEELGTTFVKLGQILSTRADLLPQDYLQELARLQDSVSPLPFETVKQVVVKQLAQPLEAAFAAFDPVPLASASIGQVHAATLLDGTEVVVKVRRPGAVEQVEEDLQILHELAAAAARRWDVAEQYDVVGLVREFSDTLTAELDYLRESENIERFARMFKDDPNVHIPRVYWGLTTSSVLTMERIRGIKVSDTEALDAAGIDRKALAQRAAGVLLTMVFRHGFFHADPHPGNVLVEPGGRIGLIDFGMVGTLDERTQQQLEDIVLAVASEDAEQLVDALLEVCTPRAGVSRRILERDVNELVSRYYRKALGEFHIGPALRDIFTILRRHRLQLPTHVFLLLKTLGMAEGVAATLDPEFRMAAALVPYARGVMYRRYTPGYWAPRLRGVSQDLAWLGVQLPRHLRRTIRSLERGDITFRVQPGDVDTLMRRVERLMNRLVLGIICAACINGVAVLLSAFRPTGWEWWVRVMFGLGWLLVAVLGLYLAWSILRPGRR